MSFCEKCGTELTQKQHPEDGMVPWCETCQDYRFPGFSTAVSMVVLNPAQDKILLIQQYGLGNILVAGYVSKGENLEETVAREVKEETGLNVVSCAFNASQYYAKSNTLMVNFSCVVEDEALTLNPGEVDSAAWYPVDEVREAIRPKSLAKTFLEHYLDVMRQA